MTTSYASHPWDGRKLTPEEISKEKEVLDEIRSEEKSRILRFSWWYLDRFYLRALRNGEDITHARTNANFWWGFLNGGAAGAIVVAFFLGVLGYFYHLAVVLNTTNTIFAIAIWIILFAIGFRWVRKKIAMALRPLCAKIPKFKRKPKEAA